MREIVIAGNWKMYKGLNEVLEFCAEIRAQLKGKELCGVLPILAPAYPFLAIMMKELEGTGVQIAAQNVSNHNEGAYTGEVSSAMLASLSIPYCIVGHSERRAYHSESDEIIREKIMALLTEEIKPILCIGENLDQRNKGETQRVIMEQLEGCLRNVTLYSPSDMMIAYEPIWAIGTGRTASGEQAQEVHRMIRKWLAIRYTDELADGIKILYGGSVKPENLERLLKMPDLDGGLIGGASLKADKYLKMIEIALDQVAGRNS
nr:triosephosphate isomerase [Candidatus Cloacimonadota bacterium]